MKKEKMKEMDVVFLLDRSGSMTGMEMDTIGGYNSYLEKQRRNGYKTKITTVLFDDKYEVLKMREDIQNVSNITNKEYYCRGCTALYDAIGKTIKTIENSVNNKVLFVITTDGLENASREYNRNSVFNLIKKHDNWEFIYIGANIDSYAEGQNIGIRSSNIANYKKTTDGTKRMFNAVYEATSCLMDCGEVGTSWKNKLED